MCIGGTVIIIALLWQICQISDNGRDLFLFVPPLYNPWLQEKSIWFQGNGSLHQGGWPGQITKIWWIKHAVVIRSNEGIKRWQWVFDVVSTYVSDYVLLQTATSGDKNIALLRKRRFGIQNGLQVLFCAAARLRTSHDPTDRTHLLGIILIYIKVLVFVCFSV